MGEILHDLVRIKLPDREAHNSHLFIDLCENIHIHYREFRIVFSLDEYFEFAGIVQQSTEDVRNYLAQNPDYKERTYPTTLMVAGGKIRQRQLLENSPRPNESTYFANDFAIELQAETVVDEIHVHWRDYRIALNREHFKQIADAFTVAKAELEAFEANHPYERRPHHDRTMEDFQKEREKYKDYQAVIMDEKILNINSIKSRYKDIETDFHPEPKSIQLLVNLYRDGERVFPILLSTEKNGEHHVIDGNHRLLAAKKAGLEKINCIVSDITFEQSANFRKAESLLKQFDQDTGHKYNTSAFNREFIAYHMGRFYRNHFYRAMNPSLRVRIKFSIRRLSRWLKRWPVVHSLVRKVYNVFKPQKTS